MNENEWKVILSCAKMKELKFIPIALIVDSPWIPGFLNISHTAFYAIPEVWLECYFEIKRRFPQIIFIPDFWVEFGMAQEPSGFGAKVIFSKNATPNIEPVIKSADDLPAYVNGIKKPNPKTDGLMPLVLEIYKYVEPIINKRNQFIKLVASRGPLAIASHLMGVSEFLIALKLYPEETNKLIKVITEFIIDWYEAQIEVLNNVEGILLLDDIVGFLSEEDYLEFAHPYLKKIFDYFYFPVKIYHNDTNNAAFYRYIPDLGVNIFNFTHLQDIKEVYEITQGKVCLMGNVPPYDVLVNGNEEITMEYAKNILMKFDDKKGLILSAGGGVSPNTPQKNIEALIQSINYL